MGHRIRWYQPGVVYAASQSVVDRQFQFKPNHHLGEPLLHIDCPEDAFDPDNPHCPVFSTINIIGAAYARAQKITKGVHLHALECNVNHIHTLFSFDRGCHENVAVFFRNANALLARQVNTLHKREGHLFGGRIRVTACLTNADAEQKLLYALTNTVKDGLADTVTASPFFSTYRSQAEEKPLVFKYFDYDAYAAAKREQDNKVRLKDFVQPVTLEIAPLPHMKDLKIHARKTWTKKQVQSIESALRNERKDQNQTVMSVADLYAISRDDKPKTPRTSGPQPLCHCCDEKLKKQYLEERRQVLKEHQKSSIRYRSGDDQVEFPPGTFKPVVIQKLESDAIKIAKDSKERPPPDA